MKGAMDAFHIAVENGLFHSFVSATPVFGLDFVYEFGNKEESEDINIAVYLSFVTLFLCNTFGRQKNSATALAYFFSRISSFFNILKKVG